MAKFSWGALSTVAGALAAVGAMLMDLEGYVPVGYTDIAGIPTACVGHTGDGVVVGRRYTTKQCMDWLNSDMGKAWNAVGRNATVSLPLHEQAAFTLWTFNFGEGNLRTSTLLKKLNAGDHFGACKEILRWNKIPVIDEKIGQPVMIVGPDGKLRKLMQEVRGLTERRKKEYAICMGQDV
jgi:lysozyme